MNEPDSKIPGQPTALVPAERQRSVTAIVDALPEDVRAAMPPWARKLAYVLDDFIKIPGLDRGVGIDAIIGLILPGMGDAMTAFGSTALLVLALKKRVPAVILGRMVLNIGVDAVLGAVPIVGDLFDVFFRSNRRNLELIEAHQGGSEPPTSKDYAIVGVGFGLAVMSVVLPIALLLAFGVKLGEWLATF